MRALQRLIYRHRMRGLPHLPLLGLMRVGTNVTRAVLETHYQVQVDYNRLGWKHGLIPTLAPGCDWRYPAEAPLVVVKHPLAVIHSLREYARKVGRNLQVANAEDLSAFLRGRVIYRCDELLPRPEYRFANAVQVWNDVVWNHLQFARQTGGLVIRYEDLLREPAMTCDAVARHFQLRAKPDSGPARLPEQAARRMKDEPGRKRQLYLSDEAFDKTAFFLEGQFLSDFSEADQAFADSELDPDLMQDLGCHLREPTRLTPMTGPTNALGPAVAR